MDTIFDTDNLGTDSKPYHIEFKDAENGSVIFAGSNSVFWNLLYETFWNDYGVHEGVETIGYRTVSAMASLGGGSNPYQGVVNFFKKYFWDNAQYYFPQSAYNVDASFKYEDGWTSGVQQDALNQSLGRHLEAERLWCERRAIYVMSLFKVGPFRSYSDQSLGRITFRPSSLVNPTVTPTLWMYPAVFFGEGSPEATARTIAGDEHEFTGTYGVGGQNNFYFQATDYMSSLGNWKDLQLANGYVTGIDITGAKLRDFKIGESNIYYTQDEIDNAVEGDDAYGKTTDDIKIAASVTTNVPGLTFTNTKCLEEIDARNASSLTGSVDLSVCTRLQRAYFEGTSLSSVLLPNGSKIESLHLPDTSNAVILRNLKFLTDLKLPSDPSVIRTLQVENCEHQDPFETLKECFNTENAALQYIRIIWSGTNVATAREVHMLSLIAQGLKADEETEVAYRGINAQGNIEGYPVIEGTVQMEAGMRLADLEALQVVQTEDYPGGLKRALSSLFGTLFVIYNPNLLYMDFVDPVFGALCIEQWGDGYGVTMAALAAVTNQQWRDFGASKLYGNSSITSLDDFKYFTSVNQIYSSSNKGSIANMANVTSITTPGSITRIQAYNMQSCPNLTTWHLGGPVTGTGETQTWIRNSAKFKYVYVTNLNHWLDSSIPTDAMASDNRLYIDDKEITTLEIPNTRTSIRAQCFYGFNRITSITLPSTLTSIGNYAFYGCSGLTNLSIPSSVTSIGSYAFYGCSNLASIEFPESITSIGDYAFRYSVVSGDIYLPNLTSVGDYGLRNMPNIVNLYVPKLSASTLKIGLSGNGTGTLTIGSITASTDAQTLNFRTIIILGNISTTVTNNAYFIRADNTHKQSVVRVKGNISISRTFITTSGASTKNDLRFFEMIGTGTVTNSALIFDAVALSSSGCIIHLGHNGVACIPSIIQASSSYVTKIYIGPGESEEGDQAILNQYLEDEA